MRETHHVYLIPGFFGFTNLGRLRYFVHVDRFLRQHFAARGLHAVVHVVRTHPTASLTVRAVRVFETMARTLRARSAVAHLIGHSTGGLDARLVTAPGVVLPTNLDRARYAEWVRSVVGVASPHHGAPLAAFFAGFRGQQVTELLSVSTAYVLRFGQVPLTAALTLAALLSPSGRANRRPRLVDDVFGRLLADFSLSRRRAVHRLLHDVATDQSLLLQLTPEAIDVFNATVGDRAGVRYGCVVASAQPPGLRGALAAGLDPVAQANQAVYRALYQLTTGGGHAKSGPALTAAQRSALRRAFGAVPSVRASDGIVPTLAQVWGEVIAGARGDHLDVIGHFAEPDTDPPHYDWLTTGSGFDRAQFDHVWTRIADFLVPATVSRV